MKECLLELDMDTGRCRIAALPGMGEDLKLRWFTEDWLLVQKRGNPLRRLCPAHPHAYREVLRIRPGMFGGEKLQHIGMLTDGTVVIVTRRNRVGPVVRYPKDFWGFLRTASKSRSWSLAGSTRSCTPHIPFFLPGEEPKPPQDGENIRLVTDGLLRPRFDQLSQEEKQVLMERVADRYNLKIFAYGNL